MAKVIIMLSTYNGEKYLKEQLDSVLDQSYSEFCINVRDDGSTDNTAKILEHYKNIDKRVTYYLGNNIGARDSFYDLMINADVADYYAFCDQDDVWERDKLEVAIECLKKRDNSIPQMYCSNLSIVDENLKLYRMCHSIDFELKNKFYAFTEYPAVGCTVVFNSAAMTLIRSTIPNEATMHDAWVYMCCQFFGNVFYDKNPHIMYRQHDKNVIGTKKSIISIWKARIARLFDTTIQPRLNNAYVFNSYFRDILREEDREGLDTLLLYKSGFKRRVKAVVSKKLTAASLERTIRLKLLTIWGLL